VNIFQFKDHKYQNTNKKFKTLETSQVNLGLYIRLYIKTKTFINLGIKVGLLHYEVPQNSNVCISIYLCVFITE
jgi:hypothetical protein